MILVVEWMRNPTKSYDEKHNVCVHTCHKNNQIHILSTTTCVTICAYYNIPRSTFLKLYLEQVQLLVLILESLKELCLCHIKKVLDVGLTVFKTFS